MSERPSLAEPSSRKPKDVPQHGSERRGEKRECGAPAFAGLGKLADGSFLNSAASVSADGAYIVGSNTDDRGTRAFRSTISGQKLWLGNPADGGVASWAEDVAADGSSIAGSSKTATGYEAFRWTKARGRVSLGELPDGSTSTWGMAISDDGSTIVGYGLIRHDDPRYFVAFLWTARDGVVPLDEGLPKGAALDISADGSTVIGYREGVTGREAFRWTRQSGVRGLGDLRGGAFFSEAHAVSADGSTVVGQGESVFGHEAFRWTSERGMVGLGDLPGGIFFSRALGVSADGSTVVGQSENERGKRAMIWNVTSGLRALDEVLRDRGLELGSWRLVEARSISSNGCTIVGIGVNPSGHEEAWVAVVP